ncbi:MAG: sulfite exporter TauE/SafE family protein [Patescibacteria group bacterium]
MSNIKEHIYHVKGMHCASCELIIEKRMLEFKNVKSVEASVKNEQIRIEFEGELPETNELNKIFEKENYIFSNQMLKTKEKEQEQGKKNDTSTIVGVAIFIIIGFSLIKNSNLSGIINVTSKSSLPAFLFLGLLAGVSSCAALVGGLILSMSKQWTEMYSEKDSTKKKLQPHIMFNVGRVIAYTVLGGLIGAIGSKFQVSLVFTSILIVAVSIMMFFLSLQMLGVKAFRKFQFTMPKFITRRIADETKFKGKYMPFIMGALTFFLPCGFTITAQGLALISGGAVQGALIMFFFALGTLPALFAIGLSSIKFSQKPHLAGKFLKIAGILVLFFALFNLNAQLNALGLPSLSNLNLNSVQDNNTTKGEIKDLAPMVNGKQILKMQASASRYTPNYFKVRVNVPVRWEITDTGTSGCTNAVISRNLFSGSIDLAPGKTSVKEFTPTKVGKYKFSCWMGMVSGVMEVI